MKLSKNLDFTQFFRSVHIKHHISTGTVAFEVNLDAYTSIPVDSYVIFNQIFLNIGDG